MTFDGNPLSYWLFINNFEVNVAKRVPDAETLFNTVPERVEKQLRTVPSYPIQNSGDLVSHIWTETHRCAYAHREDNGRLSAVRSTDVVDLSDLSVQMQNCALTLVQMGYEANVNGSENLVMVVKRLPVHLQSKWADRAGLLSLAGTEPNFMHLAEFVEEKSMLGNTMYEGIVGSTPDKEWSSNCRPK